MSLDSTNIEENKDTEDTETSNEFLSNETLGEYLHKVRIMNRIDLEKMSEDTKLSRSYLEAIEKNEFGLIPGDTYIIIFLKNIAKYLHLDADKIVDAYYTQTNKVTQAVNFEEKFNIVDEVSNARSTSSKKTFWTIILLSIAFFVVLFMVKKEQNASINIRQVNTKVNAISDSIIIKDSLGISESLIKDSSLIKDTNSIIQAKVNIESVAETVKLKPVKPKKARFRNETNGAQKIILTSSTDKLLIRAFKNGKLWSNVFNNEDYKQFAYDEVAYFYISSLRKCSIKLNGKLISIDAGGKRFIKCANSSVELISKEEWKSLIKQ